ncbi:helix-turn-helix transcriptional regulator [Rhizobium sp. SSA_523]|uniref:transcriptional regulator VisN n=1 Tax=Rhizobium sp. SSA_523 TaxID=2952477 RepID=UPI0020914915|nr:helix-turn-helix transcriptional regulator [Rhizobium sp. SSA_523]MCO5732988.1 helix-turn-helix transcriptional regulator [Rhizobium sp. SSA_523]WKC23872.1 helix-turn-helix transcriptional regulator [Rhizobium sp. SSA_523]
MELQSADIRPEGRHSIDSAGPKSGTRDLFLRRLSISGATGNMQAVMRLLTDYVGASRYLLARYDLIQEQGLNSIVASDWPFDLVRQLSENLARGYAKSTEIEKCLAVLTPQFALLPDEAEVQDEISRQYCALTFCAGRTRYSVMLLFLEGLILSQERLREIGLLAGYALSLGETRAGRVDRDFDLTDRELECLFWIAEGKTSDEIAVILGISRNTINNYITSVMRKTATKTRSEAIAYAVRNNLV